jgi:uncharacterized integral membrane protein
MIPAGTRQKIRLIVLGVILVYLFLLVLFNLTLVSINFLFFTISMPAAVLIVFCAFLGIGVQWGIQAFRRYRLKDSEPPPIP